MYLSVSKYNVLIENLRCSKVSNQEMIAVKKTVYYSWFLRGGDTPYHRGPHGEASESVKRWRERGTVGKSLYCAFFSMNTARKDKQA